MGSLLTVVSIIVYLINIAHSIDCITLEDNIKCQLGCTETNSTTTCSCSTEGLTDLYFSIPTYRSSDWNKQMSIIKNMTDAAVKPSSGVGIQTFGSTANQLIPITNISTLTYPIMDSLIDDITYSTDTTNNLQLAMDNVITAFSIRNQPKRQKFHIVIMTANPTSTDNFYDIVDICSKATQIKQQNIRSYVITIGLDYVRFNRELLECLVEDPSTDIFQIPTLNGYAYEEALVSLLDNVCSDDYDFKITEIKPMINGDNDIIPRFLEGYNYGKDIKVNDLRAIFGPSNMLNNVIIPQGEFFTFYDGYPPYQDYQCKGICMNVSLIKGPNSAIEWEATIESGQDPDNPNNALIIDRIAPFSILYWQTISNGYSYQLRNIGYNNQYGANWRQSCSISANMNNKPDDECIYFPNQCHNDTQCQLSGDINGKCNTVNTAYCDCSSYGYFSDGPTCAPIPLPTKCEAVFQGDYLRFLWDKAPYDGDIEYRLTYKSSTGSSEQVTTTMTGISINDFDTSLSKQGGNYGTIDVIINGSDGNKFTANSSLSCISFTAYPTLSPITQQPTSEPTPSPSSNPTDMPTTSVPSKSPTTPQPTSELIGSFIDGSYDYEFCNIARCNCFEETFDCCMTDTDYNSKCDTHFKQIVVTPDNDNINGTMENHLRVRMYPETYSYESIIHWEIGELRVINKSICGVPEDGSSGQERRRRLGSNSYSCDDLLVNDVNVGLYPLSGYVAMNSITNEEDLPLMNLVNLTAYQHDMICNDDDGGYTGYCYDKCHDIAVEYPFELINCSTNNPLDPTHINKCHTMFPYKLNIYVSRSDCDRFPHPNKSTTDDSNANESWVWWIIIAFVVFMIILGWLAYRFWITKRGAIHGLKQYGLSQQLADADKEFMDDLVNGGGDIIDDDIDEIQNEIEMKKKVEDAESQMVDVEHDVFQVRQQSSVSFDQQSPR